MDDRTAADRKILDEIHAERARREVAVTEIDARTRHWIGGADGSGLAVAFWGAVATLVGAILQGVAGIWS